MTTGTPDPRVGLCSICQHARVIESGKGSRFYLCERSLTDPRYRKYPPLPVMQCPGWGVSPSAGL